MSLFFDVWTKDGFVLVSDVRIITNGSAGFGHKIARVNSGSPTKCAIAVCGEYPNVVIQFFHEAVAKRDTLREIAHEFAKRWVERFGGTQEYSAVHLVGFQTTGDGKLDIPQMWFWANWRPNGYASKEECQAELASFDQPIPRNNHIPYKIHETTGRFPEPNPHSEAEFVRSFLRLFGPYFTWNGDLKYWQSAAGSVGAATNLLGGVAQNWTIDRIATATRECLAFLARIGVLLPHSTVGLSDESECDVVAVTPDKVETLNWVKF